MDYEKKYKDLYSRLKKVFDTTKSQEVIDMLFDNFREELYESEDERIRKSILRKMRACQKQSNFFSEEEIAWLEKQKEQSMSATEVLVKAGLKPYKDGNQWCILAGDNIQEGICGFGDTIDEALYQFLMEVLEKQKEPHYTKRNELFDKCVENCDPKVMKEVSNKVDEMLQKEQKPLECIKFDNEFENQISHLIASVLNGEHKYNEGFVKYVAQSLLGYAKREEKYAEWNEGDEETLERAIDCVRTWEIDYCDGDNKISERLKSLCSQPKQNANDMITPNKKFFQWIYDRLVNVHKENPNVDYMISFKERIEELPLDEPHWKPNKEQMDALKNVVYGYYQNSDRFLLYELYEQLKKLM